MDGTKLLFTKELLFEVTELKKKNRSRASSLTKKPELSTIENPKS
jgi:hypothetical protein